MFWVALGMAGRGGMFLAPAGNPSSLRFGHPDVATEHTGLSPTPFSPPLREGGVVGAAHQRLRTAGRMAWEECARRREGEYWGEVPQTARRGTR